MKKITNIILLAIVSIYLVGCAKHSYYENTYLKKLDTFTQITGIESTSSMINDDGSATVYAYLVDNNASGLSSILQYEQYLINYGMEVSYSDEMYTYYAMDGNFIMLTGKTNLNDNIINYFVAVPINDPKDQYDSSNGNIEDDYNKLIELASSGDYKGAVELYNNSNLSENFDGYLDSKKYFFYSEGMNYYEQKCYGDAYEMLNQYCRGLLNADSTIKNIENEAFIYDGLYKNKSKEYGMYMSIYHGKVSFEMGDKPTDTMYYDNLIGYTYTTGEMGLAIGYSNVMAEPTINYLIKLTSGDNLIVGAAEGSEYATYSGAYEKISNTPIKER